MITFSEGAVSWQSKLEKLCCFVNYKGWVYCNYESLQQSHVDEEVSTSVGPRARKICFVLWQSKCNSSYQEFHVTLTFKTYWCEVSLDSSSVKVEDATANENGSNMMIEGLLKEKHVVCWEITGKGSPPPHNREREIVVLVPLMWKARGKHMWRFKILAKVNFERKKKKSLKALDVESMSFIPKSSYAY